MVATATVVDIGTAETLVIKMTSDHGNANNQGNHDNVSNQSSHNCAQTVMYSGCYFVRS